MSIKVFNKPENLITVGQGEYIVYHQVSNGEKIAPNREIFNSIYTVLSHLNSPLVDQRYDVIRNKIKSLDPSLEITFIPRTYYELHFLKKCIKEDLKQGDFCLNEKNQPNPYAPNKIKDCWHLVHFSHEEDNQAEGVKVVAFNMNENLVKKLNKHLKNESTFSFQKISNRCNEQIQFFNQFGRNFDLASKNAQGQFCSHYFSEGTPMHKFSRGGCMSITTLHDAEIVRNAVSLECHEIAEKSFLLFRGTDFPTDLPYSPNNVSQPYSFSFGSGLFAGALYRQGATSFNYMKDSKDGYVMAVPAQDLQHSPFVIPKKHTLCHLSSHYGTVFHPRTKIWHTNGDIWGGLNHHLGNSFAGPFFCSLDKETLSDQVLNFKRNNVIFLNSTQNETMVVPPAFQPTIHIYAQIPPGTNLSIRGNGAGLSWNKGQPLVEIEDNHWIYPVSKNFETIEYKTLIDDKIWEPIKGNHTLKAGNNATVEAVDFKLPSTPPLGKCTRLSIRCDAGKGNAFKIYGTGPGMSWQKGVDLKKVGDDLWVWETSSYFNNFEYKIATNSNRWETGPNHRAQFGKMEEVFSRF